MREWVSQGFVNCKSPPRVNVSKSMSTLQEPFPKMKADRRPRSQTGGKSQGMRGRQAWKAERRLNKGKGVNPPTLDPCVHRWVWFRTHPLPSLRSGWSQCTVNRQLYFLRQKMSRKMTYIFISGYTGAPFRRQHRKIKISSLERLGLLA